MAAKGLVCLVNGVRLVSHPPVYLLLISPRRLLCLLPCVPHCLLCLLPCAPRCLLCLLPCELLSRGVHASQHQAIVREGFATALCLGRLLHIFATHQSLDPAYLMRFLLCPTSCPHGFLSILPLTLFHLPLITTLFFRLQRRKAIRRRK